MNQPPLPLGQKMLVHLMTHSMVQGPACVLIVTLSTVLFPFSGPDSSRPDIKVQVQNSLEAHQAGSKEEREK